MASTYRSPAGAERVREWCSAGLATWEVPHSTHEVPTCWGETHVVAAGTGDSTCVFLPGTNFNAASSTPLLSQLATDCRVYAADLPGQPGLSTATRPHPELSGYAAWLRDLIAWVKERHRHGRIVLAGHSRGAAVAMSAEPDSVDALVLLAPAGLIGVRPSIAMLRATVPWLVQRNSAGARRLLEYMSGPAQTPRDEMVGWMTLVAQTCHTTGAPGPLPDDTLRHWQSRRVLVAVGEHDAFFPIGRLRGPCRSKLGREPSVIPGAGHLVVDEEPVLLAGLITSLM